MMWVDQTLQEGVRRGIDKEKIERLMQLLEKIPINVIEVKVTDWEKNGLPQLNLTQRQQIRGKVNGTVEEVELAYKLGFKDIIIDCAPYLGQGLSNQVCTAFFTAQRRRMNIGICIQNASQFSVEEMGLLWRDIPIDGIGNFIYGDKDSLLDPLTTSRILALLKHKIPVPLEFHGHNAYGLATANALAAYQIGVKRIAVSIAGIGLQGHAALEELIMAKKRLLGDRTEDTQSLAQLCSQILSAIEIMVPSTKAIIGQDIFAHESGIHVDGMIKNPILYEAFSPEEVGLERKLVIGKHSGTASIKAKFRYENIRLSTGDASFLLKQVRKLAMAQKRQVEDHILWNLYKAMLSDPNRGTWSSEG